MLKRQKLFRYFIYIEEKIPFSKKIKIKKKKTKKKQKSDKICN